LMAGGQLGSVIHNTAPSAVLLALLVVVLTDSARKAARSALKMSASENNKTEKQEVAEQTAITPGDMFLNPMTDAAAARRFMGLPNGAAWLVAVWMTLIGIVLCKGLYLTICSPAAVVLLGSFGLRFAQHLSERPSTSAEELDYKELAFPLARWSFLAGILAAICGIGGGMVMGPILVEMNVPPKVSAATTATTLLVLSSSTGLVYWCRGVAPLDYSLALSTVTMCGAMAGKLVIGWWVERTGKQSIIVWCLLLITVLSASLMGLLGLLNVVETGWHSLHFKNFCHQAHVCEFSHTCFAHQG